MMSLEREFATVLFDRWYGEMKEEWFKVEVLQDYSAEDQGPSLNAWLRGDRQASLDILHAEAEANEWVGIARSSPAKKIRIHVVDSPHTPYLEWELEVYKAINIPLAGEEVRMVEREKVADLLLPDGDFMVFDRKRVVRNHYGATGLMHKADFYDEGDDISGFLALRQSLLMAIAQPVSEDMLPSSMGQ